MMALLMGFAALLAGGIMWAVAIVAIRNVVMSGHKRDLRAIEALKAARENIPAAAVEQSAAAPGTPHLRNAAVATVKGTAKAVKWTAPRLVAGTAAVLKQTGKAAKTAKFAYLNAKASKSSKAAKAAEEKPEMATPTSPVFTREEVSNLEIPTFMRKQEEKNSAISALSKKRGESPFSFVPKSLPDQSGCAKPCPTRKNRVVVDHCDPSDQKHRPKRHLRIDAVLPNFQKPE